MKRANVLTAGQWVLAVLGLFLVSPSVAVAQEFPTRPIRIVVGFPAGGGVDSSARVIGEAMSRGLGQSIVVENKPGAAGTLGAAEVARSAPDGYTLLVTPGGHSIYGAIFNSLPFDTVKSFDWISNIVTVPFYVVVSANSPFKSVGDIVAAAKASPGTVTFGSAGPGTTHHLGIELLGSRTGVKFLHVPYRGDAPLITALIGGQVQFGLATPTLTSENIKAGRLRALATTANVRSQAMPDVPTIEQALGIQNFDVTTWFGLAGPAGMPPSVLARLNTELQKAVGSSEVRSRLAGIGGEIATTTPDQMRDRVTRELQVWTRTVGDAGIPKQ